MPKPKPSVERHTFKGQGLTLKVERRETAIAMRVLYQDRRLRAEDGKDKMLVAGERWTLESSLHPAFDTAERIVFVRGATRYFDRTKAVLQFGKLADARALVRTIGKLVAKVRLPGKEKSDA